MGIDLVAKGADFSANAIGYEAPVTRGLRYWGFLGGGTSADAAVRTARARKNWAGGSAALLVGAPVIADYALTGMKSGVNYLDTLIAETASMTAILVSRVPTADLAANATRPMMLGNGASTALPGINLYYANTTGLPKGSLTASLYHNVAGTTTIAASTITIPDITVWHASAFVADAGVGYRLRDMTAALTSGVVANTNARVVGATTLRVGSGGRSDYAGAHDVAFAALYSVALTDAEIDSIYAAVKTYLAPRGIAI